MQPIRSRYISFSITGLLIALVTMSLLLRDSTDIETMKESLITHSFTNEVSDESENTLYQAAPSKVSQHESTGIEKDYQSVVSNSSESTKDELKIAKTLPLLQLDLRLAGTVLSGQESSYALIVEETSGGQNLYTIGESIKGARLLKIDKQSVIFEKEGERYVLKVMRGNHSVRPSSETLDGLGPLSPEITEELPFFEPVYSKTGPPVSPENLSKKLPGFVPFENDSGPPGF